MFSDTRGQRAGEEAHGGQTGRALRLHHHRIHNILVANGGGLTDERRLEKHRQSEWTGLLFFALLTVIYIIYTLHVMFSISNFCIL